MIYMTYHRQGKVYAVALLVEMRHGVYAVYHQMQGEFFTVKHSKTVFTHWFDVVVAAQLHMEYRMGIPVEEWICPIDSFEIPTQDTAKWAELVCRVLLRRLNGSIRVAQESYASEMRLDSFQAAMQIQSVFHAIETQQSRQYREWILHPILDHALRKNHKLNQAIAWYKRFSSGSRDEIRERLIELYDFDIMP